MCWISQRSASVSLPTLHSNFIFNWRRHKFISHRTFAWRMSWREMKGKSVEQSHLVCGILQLHCIQKMNCIQHQQTTTCEHKNKPTNCVCSGKLNCDALMISFLSIFFLNICLMLGDWWYDAQFEQVFWVIGQRYHWVLGTLSPRSTRLPDDFIFQRMHKTSLLIWTLYGNNVYLRWVHGRRCWAGCNSSLNSSLLHNEDIVGCGIWLFCKSRPNNIKY